MAEYDIFTSESVSEGHPDKVADQVSAMTRAAWLNFARTGNPTGGIVPDWPSYTSPDRATMVINAETGVQERPEDATRVIWRESATGSL